MMELASVVVSALVETYNTVDWGRAGDFMAFIRETAETMILVVGSNQDQRTDKEKDDNGSPKP